MLNFIYSTIYSIIHRTILLRQGLFLSPLILCFAFLFFLNGCTLSIPYTLYEDERSLETILADNALLAAVKGRLIDKNPSAAFSVSVYCFAGHVFLLGYVSPEFREEALQVARTTDQVRKVTTHWYTTPAVSTIDDIEIRINLNVALITALDVSSTQFVLNVHNGHVVILGVVGSRKAADRIIDIIKNTVGVSRVTSYLMQ